MNTDYRTVIREGTGEVEVKKSRFLSLLCHVTNEDEAEERLKAVKKKYYDASHSCSAYILNSDIGKRHSSDDGEPSGTAGKPILDVLSGAGLFDSMIIVTRYFGGTLLGTGGLVRAYTAAAAEAVKSASVVDVVNATLTEFTVDYVTFPKLDHLISEMGIDRSGTEYLDTVKTGIFLKPSDAGAFYKKLADMTNGALTESSASKKECMYYMNDGVPVIL